MVSLLPFGSHFVKNCFSSLQVYFLADKSLHFSSVKYGSLMSAQSLPNVFMPFLGGLVLDSKVPVSYSITILCCSSSIVHTCTTDSSQQGCTCWSCGRLDYAFYSN
jgi:hypothetical protein